MSYVKPCNWRKLSGLPDKDELYSSWLEANEVTDIEFEMVSESKIEKLLPVVKNIILSDKLISGIKE